LTKFASADSREINRDGTTRTRVSQGLFTCLRGSYVTGKTWQCRTFARASTLYEIREFLE